MSKFVTERRATVVWKFPNNRMRVWTRNSTSFLGLDLQIPFRSIPSFSENLFGVVQMTTWGNFWNTFDLKMKLSINKRDSSNLDFTGQSSHFPLYQPQHTGWDFSDALSTTLTNNCSGFKPKQIHIYLEISPRVTWVPTLNFHDFWIFCLGNFWYLSNQFKIWKLSQATNYFPSNHSIDWAWDQVSFLHELQITSSRFTTSGRTRYSARFKFSPT